MSWYGTYLGSHVNSFDVLLLTYPVPVFVVAFGVVAVGVVAVAWFPLPAIVPLLDGLGTFDTTVEPKKKLWARSIHTYDRYVS